jgi:hypothetical protein
MSVPDAILALIRAAVPTIVVFDSAVPDQDESQSIPERYAVFWPDEGSSNFEPTNQRVAVQTTGKRFNWQVSSVAPDRQMAAWIATRIRDAITDVRPVVDGWDCGYIQHQFSVMPERDEQILAKRSVMIPDRFELLAERLDEIGS